VIAKHKDTTGFADLSGSRMMGADDVGGFAKSDDVATSA
jgi:hypothetical protein